MKWRSVLVGWILRSGLPPRWAVRGGGYAENARHLTVDAEDARAPRCSGAASRRDIIDLEAGEVRDKRVNDEVRVFKPSRCRTVATRGELLITLRSPTRRPP
jgi:hypothetical protein